MNINMALTKIEVGHRAMVQCATGSAAKLRKKYIILGRLGVPSRGLASGHC